MLKISTSLPSTAIFGAEAERLKNVLVDHNASWFRALSDHIEIETDEDVSPWVSTWRSSTTDVVATPTRPNKKNGRFDTTSPVPAMRFQAETHCGYSADKIAKSAERFSIAILYKSENRDARTVFSISGKTQNNILFVNENSGRLTLLDRAGTLKLETDAPPLSHRYALLVVSYAAGKLRMQLNNEPMQETLGHIPDLEGTAELFIGCRNHRSGLAKTLGTSRISDVIYWPDRMLLGPVGEDMPPDLTLLHDFWRWNR